jgi:polyhydroxyalkanoate synthesis repressor PhaR
MTISDADMAGFSLGRSAGASAAERRRAGQRPSSQAIVATPVATKSKGSAAPAPPAAAGMGRIRLLDGALRRKKLFRQRKKKPIVAAPERRASVASKRSTMTNLSAPITIKKYANRRLYNTASSAYVTLADLAKMVKTGEDFVVYDAKTNEDITRSVLAQIIFEQEGIAGQSLLPITFLRQLIRFYGDSVQAFLPTYLEYSIDQFSGETQAIREAATRAFGQPPFSPASFGALQEMTRKNLAAFHQALGLFSPFAAAKPPPNGAAHGANGAAAETPKGDAAAAKPDIDELRVQLAEMRRRLDSLTDKPES